VATATDITVRKARGEDAAPIADLIRRAFEAQCRIYDDWTLPPMRESETSVLRAIEDGVVLVAETDGRLIGTVRARVTGGRVHIGRLAVEPDAQNLGIGRALTRAAEEAFPSAERFEVFTGHLSAGPLHLYESLGYRRVRTQVEHERLTLVFLEKLR